MSVITVTPRTVSGTRARRLDQTTGRPVMGRAVQPRHPGRLNRVHGGAAVASCAAVRPAPMAVGASAQERRMVALLIGFALVVLIGAGVVIAQFFSFSNAPHESAGQPPAVVQQR